MPDRPAGLSEAEREAMDREPPFVNVSLQRPAWRAAWKAAREFYKGRTERNEPMNGAEMIAAERERQVSAGWTPEHDATHANGELRLAGIAYAGLLDPEHGASPPAYWPFEREAWKPSDPIHNLVKAGALIAAEIDRLGGPDAA